MESLEQQLLNAYHEALELAKLPGPQHISKLPPIDSDLYTQPSDSLSHLSTDNTYSLGQFVRPRPNHEHLLRNEEVSSLTSVKPQVVSSVQPHVVSSTTTENQYKTDFGYSVGPKPTEAVRIQPVASTEPVKPQVVQTTSSTITSTTTSLPFVIQNVQNDDDKPVSFKEEKPPVEVKPHSFGNYQNSPVKSLPLLKPENHPVELFLSQNHHQPHKPFQHKPFQHEPFKPQFTHQALKEPYSEPSTHVVHSLKPHEPQYQNHHEPVQHISHQPIVSQLESHKPLPLSNTYTTFHEPIQVHDPKPPVEPHENAYHSLHENAYHSLHGNIHKPPEIKVIQHKPEPNYSYNPEPITHIVDPIPYPKPLVHHHSEPILAKPPQPITVNHEPYSESIELNHSSQYQSYQQPSEEPSVQSYSNEPYKTYVKEVEEPIENHFNNEVNHYQYSEPFEESDQYQSPSIQHYETEPANFVNTQKFKAKPPQPPSKYSQQNFKQVSATTPHPLVFGFKPVASYVSSALEGVFGPKKRPSQTYIKVPPPPPPSPPANFRQPKFFHRLPYQQNKPFRFPLGFF